MTLPFRVTAAGDASLIVMFDDGMSAADWLFHHVRGRAAGARHRLKTGGSPAVSW